jgi:hypothetical protein
MPEAMVPDAIARRVAINSPILIVFRNPSAREAIAAQFEFLLRPKAALRRDGKLHRTQEEFSRLRSLQWTVILCPDRKGLVH